MAVNDNKPLESLNNKQLGRLYNAKFKEMVNITDEILSRKWESVQKIGKILEVEMKVDKDHFLSIHMSKNKKGYNLTKYRKVDNMFKSDVKLDSYFFSVDRMFVKNHDTGKFLNFNDKVIKEITTILRSI